MLKTLNASDRIIRLQIHASVPCGRRQPTADLLQLLRAYHARTVSASVLPVWLGASTAPPAAVTYAYEDADLPSHATSATVAPGWSLSRVEWTTSTQGVPSGWVTARTAAYFDAAGQRIQCFGVYYSYDAYGRIIQAQGEEGCGIGAKQILDWRFGFNGWSQQLTTATDAIRNRSVVEVLYQSSESMVLSLPVPPAADADATPFTPGMWSITCSGAPLDGCGY